ncbi:MAG TPA: flagellar FlbD family protein [Bryobacteraceae bacterium]|jgi:flagellar protein FlbD|nr:flagellar FlbD family protein [Bryobacteraceae bacterium]
MIQLTRLNHVPLIVNSDLIEHVEVTPDTVIALTTGQKFLVLESAEEVVERVIQFRRAIVSEHGCPLKKTASSAFSDTVPAPSAAGGQ